MKKIIVSLLFACLLAGINAQAQTEEENASLNNFKEQRTAFDVSMYQLGTKYYPRFQISGYSVYQNGFGIWGAGEYSQAVIYPEWVEKGYGLQKDLFLPSINIGVSYSFNNSLFGNAKLFAGASFDPEKSYLGPLLGIYADKGRWSLKAMGAYSMLTAYKAEYSDEELAAGKPIYIKGFDPNSWWKFSLSYSLSKSLAMGIISERFYSSGAFAEYTLGTWSQRSLQNLKLRLISGQNLETNQFCFSVAVLVEIK